MAITKYARDFNNATTGMPHWKWGSRREMKAAAKPQRSSEAFDGHTVFVETTTAVHVRLGGAYVETTESDPVLRPGAVYAFPRAQGEDHLSVMTAADQPEGVVAFWQADIFEEA